MANPAAKIVLLIVEGPTDEDSLSTILKGLFPTEVKFHVVHGDLTSDHATTVNNAVMRVNGCIDKERRRYGLQWSDFKQIIHLTDTDGAYVPDECVLQGESDVIQYAEDGISCTNPEELRERNHAKSRVMDRLQATSKVHNIPYSIYYFSRNIEHVLHNQGQNLTTEEKQELADSFNETYKCEPDAFVTFISSDAVAVSGNYGESWRYIREGTNSLHRHSNFHLAFK